MGGGVFAALFLPLRVRCIQELPLGCPCLLPCLHSTRRDQTTDSLKEKKPMRTKELCAHPRSGTHTASDAALHMSEPRLRLVHGHTRSCGPLPAQDCARRPLPRRTCARRAVCPAPRSRVSAEDTGLKSELRRNQSPLGFADRRARCRCLPPPPAGCSSSSRRLGAAHLLVWKEIPKPELNSSLSDVQPPGLWENHPTRSFPHLSNANWPALS